MLPSHKKEVYLPHTEYRLISALYSLSCTGIHYCIYKKYFDSLKNKFLNSALIYWHTHTTNAYYDLAISNWCKLFGSYSEPTHYYHLLSTHALKAKLIDIDIDMEISNKEELKKYLLKLSNLTITEFDNYHQLTKDYRDRNLIHREHSPVKINDGDLYFPELEIAKKSFLSLTLILIKLFRTFYSNQDEVNFYKFIYDDFNQPDQICDLINKSIPKFIENCTPKPN